MMTQQEAFRYGFLLRCAEEGLDPAQISQRVKQANSMLGDLVNSVKNVGFWGLVAPPAIGAATGAGIGWTAANAATPRVDPADIKLQELLSAHRLYAEQLRQRNRIRQNPQSVGKLDFSFA